MKKTTLIMIASATMLMAAPAADNGTGNMMQGKGMGQGKGMMMAQGKCGQGMQKMQGKKMRKRGMQQSKKMHSPFLIKHGLPHMSRIVMLSWGDPAFGLTAEQKTALESIRKKTMGSVIKIKKEIMPLTKSILAGTYSGKSADEMKERVKKLGELEAEATIVQLQCIEETKKILTKEQLIYLLQKSMQHRKMHKMK